MPLSGTRFFAAPYGPVDALSRTESERGRSGCVVGDREGGASSGGDGLRVGLVLQAAGRVSRGSEAVQVE